MDIAALIKEVAFPIATTVMCMMYIREQAKEAREERKEIREGMEKKINLLINITAGTKSIYNIEEWED